MTAWWEYDEQIENIGTSRYPEIELLKQVHGVGTLTALTHVLTVEDPYRFRRSRDAGAYFGLRPRRRESGDSRPQLRITKEGDACVRKLLVQCAHHILGPLGRDSDLRRWGLELAARGGKNAKKRALVDCTTRDAVRSGDSQSWNRSGIGVLRCRLHPQAERVIGLF